MSELFTRAASFAPSSYNAEAGTVEAIISTGADVTRRDYQGEFTERLPIRADAWTAARQPIPVLRDHQRDTTALVGAADRLRIVDSTVRASIRLSDRLELAGFRRDIETGILTGVSIGYAVPKWTETTEGGRRVKSADAVVVHEISFTPTPADVGAGIRSMGEPMTDQERLQTIAENVGVPSTFVDGLIQRNVNLDNGRAEIIREAARNMPVIDNRQPAVVTRETSPDELARAAGEALYARTNPAHKLSDMARPFAGRRISDMLREGLRQRGLSTFGSDAEVITRAMQTTSDFTSGIFGEYFNKTLLAYQQSPLAITQVFRRGTVSDFREKHVFEISDGPALAKINETGEVTQGYVDDRKLSSYHIDSYARKTNISFQVLVNDDVSALGDLSGKMARNARQWFAGFLVDTILANPTLADTKAVFHTDHHNLASSGAVPSDVTIGAGKLAMRLQTDASGNPIDAPPRYILIPAALEMTVDKLLATIYPAQPEDAITALRNLTPIVEPRLDAAGEDGAWWLFADPSISPVFEYSELDGYTGPQVEVKPGWDVLGTEVRVVWHVGAGAIDSRGAWRNPGA